MELVDEDINSYKNYMPRVHVGRRKITSVKEKQGVDTKSTPKRY